MQCLIIGNIIVFPGLHEVIIVHVCCTCWVLITTQCRSTPNTKKKHFFMILHSKMNIFKYIFCHLSLSRLIVLPILWNYLTYSQVGIRNNTAQLPPKSKSQNAKAAALPNFWSRKKFTGWFLRPISTIIAMSTITFWKKL